MKTSGMDIRRLLTIFILLVMAASSPFEALAVTQNSIKRLVEDGNALLARGKFAQAAEKFGEALKRDESDYLVLFKRATAFISLGKTNQALNDFDRILEIKPEFAAARLQKAKLLSKTGNWEEALKVLKPMSSSRDMLEEIKSMRKLQQQAEKDIKNGHWDRCALKLEQVVQFAPLNPSIRLLRAECNMQLGNTEAVYLDLNNAVVQQPTIAENHILLAQILFFAKSDSGRALQQLRKYLHFDPENKTVKARLRQLKKLKNELDSVSNDIEKKRWRAVLLELTNNERGPGLEERLKTANSEVDIGSCEPLLVHQMALFQCIANAELERPEKAKKFCDVAEKHFSKDLHLQLAKARILIVEEKYEEASALLMRLNEESRGDKRIIELYEKAQKLQRIASQKDYYKVLGVKKNALKREIKKAYRKMTMKYHPDKYRGDLSTEQVQKKMSDINEAWEVLSDDNKREQYDNGIDPNNPQQQQQQQQQQGHPYYGSPFGAGGFDFNGGAGGEKFFFNTENIFQQFRGGGAGGGRHFQFNFG